ncbi:uncharacterized protein LOC112506229 [Cynara cardunculus var. scolymus]|nr:uncharacterized protein LOC112506229 [Cynara cardunculus var. scolymus]
MPFASGYTMSLKTLCRSVFGFGIDHNQVHSMELLEECDIHLDKELQLFQYQVFRQFKNLSESSDDGFLSLDWLSMLLDAFVVCHEDFMAILSKNEPYLSEPPLDKLVMDFFDRSIKALDICNAICDGIQKIRCWHKHLEIVSYALSSRQRKLISKGQFRRARKALTDLDHIMLDDTKDSGRFFLRRFKSFGHSNKGKSVNCHNQEQMRSLSWSTSSSWPASKQLQSLANSLIPPCENETSTTYRLANVVFMMGFVYVFVLWALVAAIPCQDRGLLTNFNIPNHFSWATPFSVLHVRIINEFKKRDGKNSFGLLKEISQMEKSVGYITNLIDSTHQFPLTEEEKEKVVVGVAELSVVSNAYENGLHPLEYQLRQVFHKIMFFRSEGLEILCRVRS